MGRRIDVEADHVLELVGEFGVVGDLEGPHPMRLQPLSHPDPSHRRGTDPDRLGHRRRGPMSRRVRRCLVGQRHHPIHRRRRQGRNARRPGLVAAQPRHPLVHEALLPAPHHRLVLADRAGDRGGALAIAGQQHNPGAPDVLLRTVAIPNDRLQSQPISRGHRYRYPFAHSAAWHKTTANGCLSLGDIPGRRMSLWRRSRSPIFCSTIIRSTAARPAVPAAQDLMRLLGRFLRRAEHRRGDRIDAA